MLASVTDLAQWRREHPPAVRRFQHGLACALAWQRMWMKAVYGPFLLLQK